MLYNVQKKFLQKSIFKCWFKSILDIGCKTQKISNISVVVTNCLQMVWTNTKNRNGNETVILEMYTVFAKSIRSLYALTIRVH